MIDPTGIKGATSLPAAVVDVAPFVDCKITFAAKGTRLACVLSTTLKPD